VLTCVYARNGGAHDNSAQQESWESGDWSFTAFYHSDGTLMQLDSNPVSLSSGEQARLACASTRKAKLGS